MSYNDSRPCCYCGALLDPLELCSCRKAKRDWFVRNTCLHDEEIEKRIDEDNARREAQKREVLR